MENVALKLNAHILTEIIWYIRDIVGQKNSYLYYKEDGTIFLKSNHPYFYQVQTQMLVIGLQFCDFFVWSNCDSVQIIIEIDEDI